MFCWGIQPPSRAAQSQFDQSNALLSQRCVLHRAQRSEARWAPSSSHLCLIAIRRHRPRQKPNKTDSISMRKYIYPWHNKVESLPLSSASWCQFTLVGKAYHSAARDVNCGHKFSSLMPTTSELVFLYYSSLVAVSDNISWCMPHFVIVIYV